MELLIFQDVLKIEDGPQNWNKVKMKASEGYRLKKKMHEAPRVPCSFQSCNSLLVRFLCTSCFPKGLPLSCLISELSSCDDVVGKRDCLCVCLLAEPGPRGRIKGMESLHNIKKDFLITGVVFPLEVVDPPSLETMTALLSGGLTQHCAMEIYYSPYMQF